MTLPSSTRIGVCEQVIAPSPVIVSSPKTSRPWSCGIVNVLPLRSSVIFLPFAIVISSAILSVRTTLPSASLLILYCKVEASNSSDTDVFWSASMLPPSVTSSANAAGIIVATIARESTLANNLFFISLNLHFTEVTVFAAISERHPRVSPSSRSGLTVSEHKFVTNR